MEVTSNECLSEVCSLLSCPLKITAARNLQGNDAQVFIDFLDRVLAQSSLDDKFQQRGLILLSKICKTCTIIPASYVLQEEIRIKRICCHGGFADVSKGEYSGLSVAVKRLRVNKGDYDRVFKGLCQEIIGWKRLAHPNILPLLGVSITADKSSFDILTEWVPNGNIMEYTKSNPKENRLRLLSEVMSGVAYLHHLKVVHGDLKGANILVALVDRTPTARVTDFGLMTMGDLSTNLLSESVLFSAGTLRWMSPELLDPGRFDSDGCLTLESDRYALGMVIYEVLTGLLPFYHMRAFSPVTAVVIDGERPEKPANAKSLGFSDTIWKLVWSCWNASRSTRPTAQQLFDDFSTAACDWVPPPVYPVEVETGDDTVASADLSALLKVPLTNVVFKA